MEPLSSLAAHVLLRTDLPDRLAHARDLWPRNTLALARGQLPALPAAVAFPQDADQLRRCLDWAGLHGVPLIPYGAGSGVCGAATGDPGALTVDLKAFRHIRRIDPAARRVHVQAGVLGQHLEDALARHGLATRHSPSSIWCSTVGGWAASRSAGQFSSRYGTFPDMLRAMEVEAPAGRFRTGEWAEGEDLHPWFIGTEGALGVITELSVEVVPLPTARRLRGYRFDRLEQAWEAMRRLLQQDLRPAVLRLYDPVDTRLAGKDTIHKENPHPDARSWWKDLGQRIAKAGTKHQLLSLPLSLPRLLNRLADGVATGCVLIAGWEGGPEVDAQADAGHREVMALGAADLGAEPGEHWYASRHEVSYRMAPIFAGGGFADTMEVAALWSRLPALYAAVRAAVGRHAVVMAHFSHAYREGCSIYFTFAGVGDLDTYDALWRDALAAAASVGATVAHHHGVGRMKQQAAARELAALAPLYHDLKRRLDPAGILNPHRLFPEQQTASIPEPPPFQPAIDAASLIARLDPRQPAAERDAWLLAAGYRLRHPDPRPLLHGLRDPVPPDDNRLIGATLQLHGRRWQLLDVPRSAAGPDLRAWLPPECYESVTVPILERERTV